MIITTWSEAKEKGLIRYFTGKPCLNGHISERRTSNGICLICDANRAAKKRSKKHKNM